MQDDPTRETKIYKRSQKITRLFNPGLFGQFFNIYGM